MPNDEKPDPLDDVKKGLGLLFRAAKNAAKSLPTDPIEKVVLDGAREVGRAVENVASSIEKEFRGDRKKKETPSEAPPPAEAGATDAPATPSASVSPPIVTPPASSSTPTSNGAPADAAPDDAPKGPRVG